MGQPFRLWRSQLVGGGEFVGLVCLKIVIGFTGVPKQGLVRQAKLVMQVAHDVWCALVFLVFVNEFKGLVQLYQRSLSVAASEQTTPFFKSRPLRRRTAGEQGDEAQSDPGCDQTRNAFLRGLHDRWW